MTAKRNREEEMTAKELATKIVDEMSTREREKVRQYAAGDYEAVVIEMFGEDTASVTACLDEIDRLCGFVPDDGE